MVVITERLPGARNDDEQELLRTAPGVAELERLWQAPAREPATRPPRTAVAARALPRLVALAWLAAMVFLIGFEPASTGETPPLWADLLSTAFLLAVAASGFAALLRAGRVALWASIGAASAGLVLAWSCRAADHHLGSWWLVELGVFGGLFALSAAALASRRRS